jgi:hypothetical protein
MAGTNCYNCGRFDIGAYCSQCGSELRPPKGLKGLWSTLKPFAQPILEYFHYLSRLATPKALVDEITTGKFHGAKLVAFALSAISLSAIFEAIFPAQAVRIVSIPFVSEAIIVGILLTVATIGYLPLHFILNRGGRGVSFAHYTLVTTAITALYYPWATLVTGVVQALTGYDATSAVSYGTTYFYVAAFAALYGRKFFNVFLWFLGYVLSIVLVIVIALLSGFFDF